MAHENTNRATLKRTTAFVRKKRISGNTVERRYHFCYTTQGRQHDFWNVFQIITTTFDIVSATGTKLQLQSWF